MSTYDPAADTIGDVLLEWSADGTIDAAIANDDLAAEQGLRTAILLSLFTDRRAEPDDDLPSGDGDRRGWWGDEFAVVEGDLIGSRLWLLDRSANRSEIPKLAKEYCAEALQWMLDDAVTEDLGVDVEAQGDQLLISITIARPRLDPTTFKFAWTWAGEARRVS